MPGCWFGPYLRRYLRLRQWTEEQLAACLPAHGFVFPAQTPPVNPADHIRDVENCLAWPFGHTLRVAFLSAVLLCLQLDPTDADVLRNALFVDMTCENSSLTHDDFGPGPDPDDD